MDLRELSEACAKARASRIECGLDPDDAHLVLVVPGEPKHGHARIAPGLFGSVVGVDEGRTMVDVLVEDVERWIARRQRQGAK